jgi:plasmid stabilization system protein ParE
VARDSAHYADLLVERIIAAVARLESHPLSGRVVPEVGDDALREIIQGNYRIVYRVNRDAVEVVTVFHGASLFRLD